MDIVELDDFIEVIPKQDNVYFNAWINRKKEFSELRAPLIEPPPGKGKVFIHQEFSKRFLSNFDRLLVYHQAGTGKTRLIVHSREYFKRYNNKHKDAVPGKDKHTINKAYILTSGKLLQDTFIDEILRHVSDDYHPSNIHRIEEKKREKAIKRKIKEFYTIKSYHEFAQEVKSMNDQQLEQMMSDVIVYVDEVHSTSTLDVREGKESKQSENDKHVEIYDSLHRAFQFGKRNKIVLLTATPMINRSLDFNSVINLILPPEMQIPISPLVSDEEHVYKDYIHGRVSYIRRQFTGAIPKYMGETIGEDPIVVWKCPMREHQKNAYLDTNKLNFETGRLQASNFVFPDTDENLTRNQVYSLYIQKNNKKEANINTEGSTIRRVVSANNTGLPQITDNEYGDRFKKMLSARGKKPLRDMSEKFYQIFKIVNNKWFDEAKHPADTPVPDNKGICFIYSNYVKFGADLLALVFQYNGYQHYKERDNAFDKIFTKKKRFALITSDTPPDIANSAFRTMNDPRNKFGEYLQVIIGSNITGKGVSINNASAVIFVTPEWNRTNEEQARDRVFRSTSAVDRLEHKRSFGLEEVMDVEIYRMVSTLDEEESVDIHLYKTSQSKSKDIANVIRQNKIYSVDSDINYERNVQPRDEPYTETCDYQKCNYEPYWPELPEDSKDVDDYSGKLRNYMHEEVKQIRKILGTLFSKSNRLPIAKFMGLFVSEPKRGKVVMDKKYAMNALDIILSDVSKQNFTDVYGRRIYIREKNNILFSSTDMYDLFYDPDDSEYSSQITVRVDPDDGNMLKKFMQQDDHKVVERAIQNMKMEDDDDEVIDMFLKLEQTIRARVFEVLFENYFNKRNDAEYVKSDEARVGEIIYTVYGRYLLTFTEPVEELNELIEKRSTAKRGRRPGIVSGGKKKVDSTKFYTDHVPKALDPSKDRRRIYIHTLYPMELTKHQLPNFLNARGIMKVFKTTEGRWRTPNMVEYTAYVDKISKYRNNIIDELIKKYDYIGSLIVNIPGTNITLLRLKDERGKWTPGRNITSFTGGEINNFMDQLEKHPRFQSLVDSGQLPEDSWKPNVLRKAYIMLGISYDGSYPKSIVPNDADFKDPKGSMEIEFYEATVMDLEELESDSSYDSDEYHSDTDSDDSESDLDDDDLI